MKVGVYQLTSVLDWKVNWQKIENAAAEASDKGCEYFFLPECFLSMSDGTKPSPYLVEEGDEHTQRFSDLAKKYNLFFVAGSAATKVGTQVINRCYNYGPNGNSLGTYDKIHLFSCDITKKGVRKQIDEGNIYTSGNKPCLLTAGQLKIGLGICFDIRFSQMAHNYSEEGANMLTFSSAFTVPTGKAHWHILNRARAIENQLFVISPAQWGKNNDRIITYGHSLIVDPWGNILADAEEGEKLITADLDLSQIEEVRNSVKMRPYLS